SSSGSIGQRHLGWARQASIVFEKDLAIERATGEIVTTAGFFAVLVTVLSSLGFASAGPDAGAKVAPGVVWLSVLFASVLGLSRTWQREREEGAIKGLIVAPIARSAIFAGKALGVLAFIIAIEVITIPTAALLLGFDLATYWGPLAVIALFANV